MSPNFIPTGVAKTYSKRDEKPVKQRAYEIKNPARPERRTGPLNFVQNGRCSIATKLLPPGEQLHGCQSQRGQAQSARLRHGGQTDVVDVEVFAAETPEANRPISPPQAPEVATNAVDSSLWPKTSSPSPGIGHQADNPERSECERRWLGHLGGSKSVRSAGA